MAPAITEHTLKTARHTTFYLACGPEDGPLIILVHGWPELSISWRHQLPCLANLGFRAIAPDMRGYGRSTVHKESSAYTLEAVVGDMIELLDAHDREQAIWVGHDWGAPLVWSIASHHPDRCVAIANLCLPYYTLERGVEACIGLVDRDVYPVDEVNFCCCCCCVYLVFLGNYLQREKKSSKSTKFFLCQATT
jgi:soluble epoxide hydrolase/lipid-phosphate phosphatase